MSDRYCLVDGCNYPYTHLTRGHRCTCGRFGHGRRECRDSNKMRELQIRVQNSNIFFPPNLYCTKPDCNHQESHSNSSHVCRECGQREYCNNNCFLNENNYGNGSVMDVKLHSQNMNVNLSPAQVRPSISQPLFTRQISVYPSSLNNSNQSYKSEKEEYYEIECPSCREHNKIPKSFTISQKNEIACCVCMEENKTRMYLPKCKHTNICENCVKQIDKNNKNKRS